MPTKLQSGANLGATAVFLTAISTILGAILFLRFGYAVGHVGFVGALFIILLGHLVTLPTAMAVSEIATNQRVAGGGVYYILSRSFGINIGAAIGLALFASQAISVAFYAIAFAEAFRPLLANVGWAASLGHRLISLPTTILVTLLVIKYGASFGVKALYPVVAVLGASLVLFFLGTGEPVEGGYQRLIDTVDGSDSLFKVFAICFPAFTGMAAGVGLSGDLKDPKRAIPLGTMAATIVGMLVYGFVAYKLAVSASSESLANNQFIMSDIAVWGPIIPMGLACATLSSAISSFLIAPRTLQALASDGIFASRGVNGLLSRVHKATGEPIPACIVSAVIAIVFVVLGDVDVVAQIISMFFMVTYGSICLVSFLQHFAADPSYRPAFRSRWYISLLGAVLCAWLSFRMSATYASLAIVVMLCLYVAVSRYNPEARGLSTMFQGAIFQISRQIQVFLQKSRKETSEEEENWRPSVVCISSSSFQRLAAFDLLRWISHRYGFGTYLHYIEGYLSRATHEQAKTTHQHLVHLTDVSGSNVFVDTLVSPSYTSAICQLIQLPGVSGKENNMLLFEFSKRDESELAAIVDNYQLVASLDFDVCILASSDRGFGYRREIHLWLMPAEYENANLMILLAYILLGHPDWKGAKIRIFSILPEKEHDQKENELRTLIRSGRLPISAMNVELIPEEAGRDRRAIITSRSRDADLIIRGFRGEALKHQKAELFTGYDDVGNVLFVNTRKAIDLIGDNEEEAEVPAKRRRAGAAAERTASEPLSAAPSLKKGA